MESVVRTEFDSIRVYRQSLVSDPMRQNCRFESQLAHQILSLWGLICPAAVLEAG